MGDDHTIGQGEGASRQEEEKEPSAALLKPLGEDAVETPSRTSSLTPTLTRTSKEPLVVNVHDEDTSQAQNPVSPVGKPNRKVRPTRRGSSQSYTQAPQRISRAEQSPPKKPGEELEDGTGLSTSATSNHSRSGGGLDASCSATLAHLPVSTDNLLHHLHTDPRSSHITLSASASAGAKVPPASVNPALLAAGGDPTGGKAARNRALSVSSKLDKGKETYEGRGSHPTSRSVSKKPSIESRISERRIEEETVAREFSSRIGLSRSTSSAVTGSPLPAAPPVEHTDMANDLTRSSAADPAHYFSYRARAASSSETRSNGSRGFLSTASTPMEDWPSHDDVHESIGTTNEGCMPSIDFRGDLVGGGLAGTPRRGSETEAHSHLFPESVDRVDISPRTGSGARFSDNTDANNAMFDLEPDSGLVAVTVSDSTSVKLETLVPGDVADKIEQTNDVDGKQALLDQVGGTSPGSRRPASVSRSSDEPRGARSFSNLDPSATDLTSPPPEDTPPRRTIRMDDLPEFEAEDNSCVNEFSTMLAEAMRGRARRNSADSSAGESVTSSRRSAIIGSSGSLHDDTPPRTDEAGLAGTLASRNPTQERARSYEGQRLTSDWNQFIHAYRSGRWDPNRIPHPPKSSRGSPPIAVGKLHSARSSPGLAQSSMASTTSGFSKLNLETEGGSYGIASYLTNNHASSPPAEGFKGYPLAKRNSETTVATRSTPLPNDGKLQTRSDQLRKEEAIPRRRTVEDTSQRAFSMYLPAIDHTGTAPASPKAGPSGKRSGPGQILLNTGAATVRLAASNYSDSAFSPLGLPSPERELLDPMASAMNPEATTSRNKSRQNSGASDTTVRSRSHLSASPWKGDAQARMDTPLYTIAASPVASPSGHPEHGEPTIDTHQPTATTSPIPEGPLPPKTASNRRSSGGIVSSTRIPPASAPIEWSNSTNIAPTDYFGAAASTQSTSPTTSRHSSFQTSRTSSSQTITARETAIEPESPPRDLSRASEGESRSRRASGSDKPRLTAHSSHGATTSSEITAGALFTSHEAPAALPSSDHHEKPTNVVSGSQEEEDYHARGFLVPPIPHDDASRRRALYGFRILHTAPDVNFDRIAHLAKLVFSSKIVLISLVDEKENWNKVEIGLGSTTMPRGNTFCGHSILAKNDEPLVVLDSKQDWRFAQNPYVVGPPYIRFYAGAPLRTTEGFNVGSLCVIDTQPRSEFPPRSRMALKEFAAIVVREMELWRDKTRLKARDRIQTSMEKFTRECLELDNSADANAATAQAKMDRVYERASKLVQKTLEADGAMVLDLASFEAVEQTHEDGSVTTEFQADPFGLEPSDESEDDVAVLDRKASFPKLPPWTILGSSETTEFLPANRNRVGTASEHAKFSDFLRSHQEGRIYEHVVPTWIRHMLPSRLQYAMVVPIFNIDKNPFAMLVAYTCDQTKQFLEGFELQFLRAIGVVILSAVLKRRMVLADKAKSNFISNISHELRTPLHGILAAAELLSDTPLDSNQTSFLKTVQACGNSLVETVNHVLDFTKLSGSKKTTLEGVIRPGVVNLARLVEETVEGCWIGQRARAMQGQSEIGSFYSPPQAGGASGQKEPVKHVETVIDIGLRKNGWQVRCEKGGLRRVLMNLIGNSLKFTSHGYVQVTLRALADEPVNGQLPIEMGVIDTGKGISKTFLKEQLFHPFSQENPLQQGTGLGLAIVNSIVRSESVNGKVDVWSSEGLGTEIRVSLNVEVEGDSQDSDTASGSSASDNNTNNNVDVQYGQDLWISLHNFDQDHRGYVLNQKVMTGYASWWGFNVLEEPNELGDILLCNEECAIVEQLLRDNDYARPLLILTANRTSRMSALVTAYVKGGGFAQMVFKPVGPERLSAALRAAFSAFDWSTPSQGTNKSLRSDYFSPAGSPIYPGRSPAPSDASMTSSSGPHRTYSRRVSGHSSIDEHSPRPSVSRESTTSTIGTHSIFETPGSHGPHSKHFVMMQSEAGPGHLLRRRSEEDKAFRRPTPRPAMAPRSTTYHEAAPMHDGRRGSSASQVEASLDGGSIPGSPVSTISLADGGVMLKMAAAPAERVQGRLARVLLVDDNHINLQLLAAYLKKRNFEYMQAVNGQQSVDAFSSKPPGYWDIILMDISMPVMDGIEATRAIRKVENDRRADRVAFLAAHRGSTSSKEEIIQERCKIFALSGRATQDDKHQAFSAGVDGYLVKPVRLASLDTLFKRLGF
ncbi:hypothetical protein NliqN6_5751 [Naganishia liquefaciens]|uniref:histidine kinase n=1 Tax=Naganishia liquefaciens TaxID=104408 RepID=A0A8H3YH10_9TREE|nr:hypothetical protein NliqN6_5751 [Naganishia liquefaciens]